MDTALDADVAALREGRAFVRPHVRTLAVVGGDAERWLNDLVTAGVDRLAEGESARSLVLTPMGRIRADVHVLRANDGFRVLQSPDQPESVLAILSPYVLSSDVQLTETDDRPAAFRLIPGAADVGLLPRPDPPAGAVEVDEAAAERWRIETGVARFPVDLDRESLPAEAGLDVPPVTDTAKGCFLGQESVARVRGLGHPTRVVMSLIADDPVDAGDDLTADGRRAGVVTSVAEAARAPVAVIARVRWDARNATLRTGRGALLRRR